MIITCPDCETRYQIKMGSIKPPGRRVRCQSCEVVWFQEPEEDRLQPSPEEKIEASPEMKPSVPDKAASDQVETSPRIDIETEAARLMAISQDARQQRKNQKKQVTTAMGGWMVLAACISAFLISGFWWRETIVRMFPAAANLYASIYLPVNVRGIKFVNVSFDRQFENGVPVLTIRGELTNITNDKVIVPRLRFGLSNGSNQELYHWTMKIKPKTLSPAGQTKFVTRLASPPGEAQSVQVRFVKKDG